MKKPKLTIALCATTLAFAMASLSAAQAELVSEEVAADSITPEPGLQEVVVIKKKPAAKTRARVVYQQESAYEPEELPVAYEPVAAAPAATARAQATAVAQANSRASVGGSIDQGIQSKMDGVRGQFEEALLKTLDRIKITVDDGASAQATAVATAEATAVAPAPAVPAVIQDSYIAVDSAPMVVGSGNEVVAEVEEEKSFASKVRVSPVIGRTTINSDFYNADSRYTAGLSLEMDVSDNLALVLGYSYSQYDIGLGASNPINGYYQQPNMYGSNLQTLQYNQNVFDAGLRLYLMPQESRFRAHVGGGIGYNMGYLNYKQNTWSTWSNPYFSNQDYEVSSFLGMLEAGAEFKVAKNVSIGGLFKYANVLSSSENQPLNNHGFFQNGYNNAPSTDQRLVGGSLARDSFYSILGTVKVAF